MSRFVDAEKREWVLNIRTSHIDELKADAGLDIGDDASMEDLGKLFLASPLRLCKALWVLCSREAERRGVDLDAFRFGFDGETRRRAVLALSEAIVDFFQDGETSKAVKGRLPALISELDTKTAEAMGTFADSLLTLPNSVGNSPESSELTPIT